MCYIYDTVIIDSNNNNNSNAENEENFQRKGKYSYIQSCEKIR